MSYTGSGFDKRLRNLLVAFQSAAPPPPSPVAVTSYGANPAPFAPPANSLLVVVSGFGFDVGSPAVFPFYGNDTTRFLPWVPYYTVIPTRADGYLVTLQLWAVEIGAVPLPEDIAFGYPYVSGVCAYAVENYNMSSPFGALFTSDIGAPANGAWNSDLDAAPAATSVVISALAGTVAGGGELDADVGLNYTSGGRFSEPANIMLKSEYRLGSVSQFCGWADVLAPSSTDAYYGDPPGPIGLAVEIKAAP